MSRSGYLEDGDIDHWQLIMWRGRVASALRGKRGQAFLRETLAALDALPEKKLVANEFDDKGCVCTLGAVGRARSVDMSDWDPEDFDSVAGRFGIADAMAREIMFLNDEGTCLCETPEQRFERMRKWVVSQIRDATP